MARATCGGRRIATRVLCCSESRNTRAWRSGLARSSAILLAVVLRALPVCAQPEVDLSHWRFYSSVDGLRESWIEDITPGPGGHYWITHGSVDAMTLFDGYGFRRLATPGANLTVREGTDGQVWALHRAPTFDFDGLQIFERERWTSYVVPNLPTLGLTRGRFAPWARDRALIIAGDRLSEFDRGSGVLHELRLARDTPLGAFTAFDVGRDGRTWIGGRGQLALVGAGAQAGSMVWRDQPLPPALRHHDVREIHDVGRDGLFVSAQSPEGGRSTLVVLRDDAWHTVVGDVPPALSLQGWAASDETWIVKSTGRSFTMEAADGTGAAPLPVRRSRALSGQLHTVLVDPDGAFWVATSLGLARHTPPVWRSPAELGRFERHVSTLFESTRGDLFALAEAALLWRHDGRWRILPVPEGLTGTDFADGLTELADGRLLFNGPTGHPTGLVTFDPARGTFNRLVHPLGRHMDLLATAPDGLMWLHTRAGTSSRLERYDGRTFTELYDAGPRWSVVPPRGLLVTTDGSIFVLPEQMGMGRLSPDGRYRSLRGADGYPGAGPFCGLEIAPGRYWFGDRDGIIELDGGRWHVVRSAMQTVRSLMRARDGTIWATAGSGLHAYRDGSWITMAAVEGLPDGGVYDVLEDRAGVIWASTSLGLSRMYKATDVDPPKTRLDPTVNPREVPPSGDLRLVFDGQDRWHQSTPRRLLFSWRLDEGSWSPFAADAGVSLRGLRAGMHRVHVRAMDRNWNVDPVPVTWEFSVLLPWYREAGFLAVGFAGALALCAVVALVASRQLRLGRLVAARTAELDESNRQLRRQLADRLRIEEERGRLEAQLHQAQKLEAIGRLAGGIAHDFNNLLTVITSYGELMQQDLSGDHAFTTPVAEIVRAADRATTLTRQLLAFGRHQVVRPQPLDLNAVVADIERMLRRLIGEDIDLEFRPGGALRSVLADRGQIEQVIVNLAVNARDAMPAGGRLTIETGNIQIDEAFARTHARTETGDYVLLAVSDTGVGMDVDTQARMFEPFFTTKGREQGSGLGLATVYGIITQAGGYVWVYSEPGCGATFKIYLPCTELPVTAAGSADIVDRPRGTEHVLLVEDDPSVRALTSTVLRGQGYTVTEAASGEAAEELLTNGCDTVDLLLSDIVLSGMSGPQLTERLKTQCPDLPVLFMSGYADDAVIRHGILESEVAFIQKPFTPDALARKVRQTLDRGED